MSAGGGAFDVVVECSGSVEGLAAAVRLARKGGAVVQVGLFGRPAVEVDLDTVVERELTLSAARGKRPGSFRLGLDLVARREIRLEPLVTDRLPLERWEEAFAIAERPGRKVVVVVAPGAAPAT
jgi:threonine dehydrogenase-like Zn-dependent dehydrogenase